MRTGKYCFTKKALVTGISGQSFRRSPGAELIVGGGRGRRGEGSGGFTPKLNKVLLAILFKNILKMLKISQPVTFSPPLYQLEASCRNLVSSWL